MIRPLAHVDNEAKSGKNVRIPPFAFIGKKVEIGDDCEIYPYVSILSGARIGNRNKIYNGAIIAAEPQDLRWKGENSFCYIGDDNKIREHSIINRGIVAEGGTRIGNNVFVMAESHLSHDCVIEDKCVIGNGAKLSPNCLVRSCSILSSNVTLHTGSDIGSWSLIKGGCRISGNVPPYVIVAHNPVTYFGVNAFVLRHCEYSEARIDEIAKAYRHIYQCGTSVFNAVKRIEQDVEPSPERDAIVNYIREHEYEIVAVSQHSHVID